MILSPPTPPSSPLNPVKGAASPTRSRTRPVRLNRRPVPDPPKTLHCPGSEQSLPVQLLAAPAQPSRRCCAVRKTSIQSDSTIDPLQPLQRCRIIQAWSSPLPSCSSTALAQPGERSCVPSRRCCAVRKTSVQSGSTVVRPSPWEDAALSRLEAVVFRPAPLLPRLNPVDGGALSKRGSYRIEIVQTKKEKCNSVVM